MLKGDRVILRPLEREDLPRMNELDNDLEFGLLGGIEPPVPRSMARLEKQFDEWMSDKNPSGVYFAIEADGEYIGGCSLHNIDRTSRTAELGIGIGERKYWGKGYGREIVCLLLDYGFRILNLHKIALRVKSTNERAIRSYRSAGFVEEGRLRRHLWSAGEYVDVVLMGVLRDERDA